MLRIRVMARSKVRVRVRMRVRVGHTVRAKVWKIRVRLGVGGSPCCASSRAAPG